jgi:hypothetical protein
MAIHAEIFGAGHQAGYAEGLHNALGTEAAEDRMLAFETGLYWGTPNQPALTEGTYKVYTDDRGLTFERGGKVYIQIINAVATVECITEETLVLSDDGVCESFPMECCRPILGTNTEYFLPIGATVIRDDGQLGVVQQNVGEDRSVGYGAGDYYCVATNLSDWTEYKIKPGTWVATPTNIWYKVTDVIDSLVVLDDDHGRYKNVHLLESLSISEFRINPEGQKYFIGQRVFSIDQGKFGFIKTKFGPNRWIVQYDGESCGIALDTPIDLEVNLMPVEFYLGQHVLYDGGTYTVEAIAQTPGDGRLQISHLRLQRDAESITADVVHVAPLTKIDASGIDLWIDATSLTSLAQVEPFSEFLTDQGKRQIVSIARYLEVI